MSAYITGVCALNLVAPEETDGDWHQSAMNWDNPTVMDTEDSVFGDFGLYMNSHVPDREQPELCANHIRACLDLLQSGKFGAVQGMRENFINNEDFTPVIFEKVLCLLDNPRWPEIDRLMGREYGCNWLDFKDGALHG